MRPALAHKTTRRGSGLVQAEAKMAGSPAKMTKRLQAKQLSIVLAYADRISPEHFG